MDNWCIACGQACEESADAYCSERCRNETLTSAGLSPVHRGQSSSSSNRDRYGQSSSTSSYLSETDTQSTAATTEEDGSGVDEQIALTKYRRFRASSRAFPTTYSSSRTLPSSPARVNGPNTLAVSTSPHYAPNFPRRVSMPAAVSLFPPKPAQFSASSSASFSSSSSSHSPRAIQPTPSSVPQSMPAPHPMLLKRSRVKRNGSGILRKPFSPSSATTRQIAGFFFPTAADLSREDGELSDADSEIDDSKTGSARPMSPGTANPFTSGQRTPTSANGKSVWSLKELSLDAEESEQQIRSNQEEAIDRFDDVDDDEPRRGRPKGVTRRISIGGSASGGR